MQSELISEEEIFKGPRFNVVRKEYLREDGKKYLRDCVNPGDAAIILPVTENNEIIFIKQYREVINKVSFELPAGMIDKGENPEDAARRELEEETGLKASNIEKLIEYYPSCGYTSEKHYVFVAKNFENTMQHLDDTEEILSIEKIKIEDCVELAKEGKFEHACLNIAILLYYNKYINGGK